MPDWSVKDIYDLAKSMVGPSTAEAMPLPKNTKDWRRAIDGVMTLMDQPGMIPDRRYVPSKASAKLLKGLYRVPALAGLGVFGQSLFSDEAEAVTPLQFWRAVKQANYDQLPRSDQAKLARSIRMLPKATLDKIDQVIPGYSTPNSRALNEADFSLQQTAPPGAPLWMNPVTQLNKSVIRIGDRADQVYKTTPTHEGLHSLWFDMRPIDKWPFLDQWLERQQLPRGTGSLDDIGSLFRSDLGDDPSELFAEYGAHRLQKTPAYEVFRQKLSPIADEFDSVLKKYVRGGKLPAALLASMGLGALAAPDSADAVMLPDVRKLMNAMKAQGGKTLFHDSWNLRGLLEGGAQDPKLASSAKEEHKPLGLYATDQLKKIPGHVTFSYKDTDTTKALKKRLLEHWGIKDYSNIEGSTDSRVARIVMKPDAVTREVPEEFMHSYNKMLAQVRKQMAKMEGDQELYQNPLAKKDLTQHWQDLVDVLKIKQVDMQPDVAEHIITNPEKIGGIFWENAAWTPEQGYQTFGESRRRVFGMPSRRGQSRLDVGLPSTEGPRTLAERERRAKLATLHQIADTPEFKKKFKEEQGKIPKGVLNTDSDLESLAEKMLAKPLEPVTKLLPKVDYTTSQLIEKPGASFYNAEPGSIEFIKQFKKDLNTLGTLKDDPNVKLGFAYPNVKNAAKQLHDMYLQPMPKQIKKGSGYIPGAIAGAMGLGALVDPEQAEAMPIGKLKPLTKPLTGMVRSEDAFYRLLGHKLRGNQEVVDVMKNPKNDWRYIISKDAEGKRSVLPMTKDYVHVYSGAKGTQDYLKRFNQEGHQGKKLQALKSLTIRETAREATSAVPEKDFRAWNKMQMEKAKEIDPDLVNDYAYVKILDDRGSGPRGQSLYMPRPYAEFLARKGYVKILKR